MLAALALAFPAGAGAAPSDCAGPTGDQYCPPVEVVAARGGESADPGDPSGLPFTGLDLGLSLAAGAGLLGAGIALRRVSRSRGAV